MSEAFERHERGFVLNLIEDITSYFSKILKK